MGREVVDDLGNRIADPMHPVFVEQTALRVCLRKPQAFQQDFVVVGRERFFFQKDAGLIGRLNGVPRQHPLVDQFRRRQAAVHRRTSLQET